MELRYKDIKHFVIWKSMEITKAWSGMSLFSVLTLGSP